MYYTDVTKRLNNSEEKSNICKKIEDIQAPYNYTQIGMVFLLR